MEEIEGINKTTFEFLKDNGYYFDYQDFYQFDLKKLGFSSPSDVIKAFLSLPADSPEKGKLAALLTQAAWEHHGKSILNEYVNQLFKTGLGANFYDKKHRDHISHQMLVFFLGLLLRKECRKITNTIKKKIICPVELNSFGEEREKDLEFLFRWRMASTFHDVTYPLFLNMNNTNKWFKDVSEKQKEVIKKHKCKEKLPEYKPKYPIHYDDFFEHLFRNKNAYDILNTKFETTFKRKIDLKDLFRERFEIDGRINHGLYSALFLLKYTDILYKDNNTEDLPVTETDEYQLNWSRDFFDISLVDVAFSIAVHDITFDKPIIKLDSCPLVFLLILSDILQEWDRKTSEEGDRKPIPGTDYILNVDDNQIQVKLQKHPEIMQKMKKELESKLVINCDIEKDGLLIIDC